jgi:hypothetical protein
MYALAPQHFHHLHLYLVYKPPRLFGVNDFYAKNVREGRISVTLAVISDHSFHMPGPSVLLSCALERRIRGNSDHHGRRKFVAQRQLLTLHFHLSWNIQRILQELVGHLWYVVVIVLSVTFSL